MEERESRRDKREEEDEESETPDQGVPFTPMRPWLCPGCGWHLFLKRTAPCPLCQKGAQAPSRDLSPLPWVNKTRGADRPPSTRSVKAYNIGMFGTPKAPIIPPKPADCIRLVCISDTHTRHWAIPDLPDGDILIHSGDFSMSGREDEVRDFAKYISSLPHKHKVVIAGNHDTVLQTDWYLSHSWRFPHPSPQSPSQLKDLLRGSCTYLEDSEVTLEGLRIYGSPWTPAYHDWAFMLPPGETLNKLWNLIPNGVDVLITHGPPSRCQKSGRGKDLGDPGLRKVVETRVRPAVHIFGHIHHSYGVYIEEQEEEEGDEADEEEEFLLGQAPSFDLDEKKKSPQKDKSSGRPITFVNATTVSQKYKPINRPIVLDISKT